jgi:hypothetical protein
VNPLPPVSLLDDPRVKARLARRPIVDRRFDMPFVAGYSKDGARVYIDRHLPARGIKIGARIVNVVPFLVIHETVESALIAVFGYKYQVAHEFATLAENRAVRAAGYDPKHTTTR